VTAGARGHAGRARSASLPHRHYPSCMTDQQWKILRPLVQVVRRSDEVKGFVVLPRRWVVERSVAWLVKHRRLVRDYERLISTHEAMVWAAGCWQLSARLAV